MTAQSMEGGPPAVTPASSNIISSENNANVAPNSKSKIRFILLAIVLLIAAGVFFASRSNFLKKQPKSLAFVLPVNAGEIEFPSAEAKNRFVENLDKAQETTDITQRYEFLKINFTSLRLFYEANHEPKLREQAQIYAEYMEKNYPEEVEKDQGLYLVPCLDTVCGQAVYPEEIEKIKAEFKNIISLEPQVLESVLKKFEAAAISSDQNIQWQNYLGAFQEIKAEKDRTKDERLGAVAAKLRDFLKVKYPEIYDQWEKDLGDPFKI